MSWPEIDTTEDIEKDVLDFVIDSFRKMLNLTDGKVTDFYFATKFKIGLGGTFETKEFYEAVFGDSNLTANYNKLTITKCNESASFFPDSKNGKVAICFNKEYFKKFIKQQYLIPNYAGNYYFVFQSNQDIWFEKRKIITKILDERNFIHYTNDKIRSQKYILRKTIELLEDVFVDVYIDNNRILIPFLKINITGESTFYHGSYAKKKMVQINIPDHMIAELNSLGMSKNSIKHSKAMKRMSRWTVGF